jgi:hypothetical protein
MTLMPAPVSCLAKANPIEPAPMMPTVFTVEVLIIVSFLVGWTAVSPAGDASILSNDGVINPPFNAPLFPLW